MTSSGHGDSGLAVPAGARSAGAESAGPASSVGPASSAGSADANTAGSGPTGANPAQPIVTLRAMRPSDLQRVAALEVELFGIGAWTYAMLEGELHGPGHYIVAVVPGTIPGADRVVGYLGMQFDGESCDIATIGVARDSQRLGIGAQLMNYLIDRATGLGAHAVLLEVAVNNEPAQAMYRRYGFEQIGLRKRYYQPENLDAYVMRLELKQEDDK